MVDSGSAINIIKLSFLNNIPIDLNDILILRGITKNPIKTQGSVIFKLAGKITKFHVVLDDISIPSDGIIGSEFLRDNNAILDYNKEVLIIKDIIIPFYKEKKVTIPARTVTPVCFNITNPEKAEGYIPFCEPVKGLYLGEALVANTQGKGHLQIYNVTERDYTIILRPMHLIDYITDFSANSSDLAKLTDSTDSTDFTDFSDFADSTDFYNSNALCYFSEPYTEIATSDRFKSLKSLINLTHLNDEEKNHVETILYKYKDCFFLPRDKLKSSNNASHSIPTTNNISVHVKQYRYPPIHREEINKQVNKLLENNIIKPSSSPYNAPLWIVPKKSFEDGEKRWRMVIDFRKLNEKTIGDAYPLPNIIEILDQLGSAKYFSIFDLAQGFHQIPMDPNDMAKTAFSTPYGHYEYQRMPFGLKNAPATFQRLMDNVLTGLQGNELFVYLDDIVVYARSLEEHKIKIENLMQRLRKANLQLQPEKCQFLRNEVVYLGHVIGSDGVKPDPNKIHAMKNFPIPKNPKNIKQFLGLTGYYRRFIKNFSKIAKPLTDLLKKDKPFIWTPLQENAFATLRNELCEEPILQYPNFNEPFILTTDACGYAIGGVLSQGLVGKDLPISYTSRVLNDAERKYSTIEKECLAIVYGVSYFRHYLYGRHFTILTDHKPWCGYTLSRTRVPDYENGV
ncbi:enzymatic polyprotein endonuclease reverse [Lasius niger]|uniref:Enzymatic polyprotein endonuclease reverse n=1 Tax=Lasius niger TaxID=67767 RepID=A0A0J7KPW8_LASNI|nr:enzymatic polyprotein endonuclease reverse [Lasius niger]